MTSPALKVAFVCQWYPPEPAGVPESIARALHDSGIELEVLTGIPNFPTGKVVEGYRAWKPLREIVDGVHVHRAPLYPSHDTSAARRILNYASWAVSSTLLGQRALRRADAVLVYSSPATAATTAMVARLLSRTPYVLLIQDLWPDSIFASGFLGGPVQRHAEAVLSSFVSLSYRWADRVLVISPGMASVLASRGVPREKIGLVYNWLPGDPQGVAPPSKDHSLDLRARFGILNNERVFLYAGNHGRAQALDALVDAFKDERTAPSHFVLLGEGVSKDELVSRAGNAPRVHFHDRVSRADAMRLAEDTNVHVVSLADHPLFATTMPSKVQSGLASGRAMLVVAHGDAAAAVEDHDAGRSARPGDVESIVSAIRDLMVASEEQLTAMGTRGRDLYRSEMAPSVGVPRLRRALEEAATRNHFRNNSPRYFGNHERTTK